MRPSEPSSSSPTPHTFEASPPVLAPGASIRRSFPTTNPLPLGAQSQGPLPSAAVPAGNPRAPEQDPSPFATNTNIPHGSFGANHALPLSGHAQTVPATGPISSDVVVGRQSLPEAEGNAPAAEAVSPTPPLNMPDMPTADVIDELDRQYGHIKQELASRKAMPYQTAYIHCLTERAVSKVFSGVGIEMRGNDGSIGGHPVDRKGVCAWMGLNWHTFKGMLTAIKSAQQVHWKLRVRLEPGGQGLTGADAEAKSILDVMLSPKDTIEPSTGNNYGVKAIGMTVAQFNRMVKGVVERERGGAGAV